VTKWIALLRGINVGGGNKVPMADLRALAEDLGWNDVATYVASGNVVFSAKGDADKLADTLRKALASGQGVDVPILVLPADRLKADLDACPFEPKEEKHVHVLFLFDQPHLDKALLADLKTPTEELSVNKQTAYLHTPDGFGRSKLGEKLGKVVGCDFTARNLRTVRTLVEMSG
jgi:uncharacterized protein (DUF1697 family)